MTSPLVADLRRLLPPDRVSEVPEDLERHSSDALGEYRAFAARQRLGSRPQAVAYPARTGDVAAVAEYAARRGIPLVPFGAGTGVMGAVVPVHGGIVLDMGRMSRVLEIDAEGRRVTVEAGAVLEDLDAALALRGLLLGHDPWSRPIATVGGAISTNGVGYLAGRYGSMGDQVLGLEVVLASGQVFATRAVPKVTGPSLCNLFAGAEGTLGVISAATLEAFPQPERRSLRAYRFPGFAAGFEAVQAMYSLGLRPALVDFAEEPFREDSGPGSSGGATLYLGLEGFEEEVAAQEGRAGRICQRAGGTELPQGEADHFWQHRHDSAERYKREVLQEEGAGRRRRSAWRMDYLHVAVPASRVLEYHRYCQALLAERGIPVREWSLWGRPEYFSLLISDPTPVGHEGSRLMAQVVDDILVAAQGMGGAMEYCHGVGLKLSPLMARELGAGLEALRAVKGALDPAGIMNPGKLGL